ncbi:hypothetical protein EMCG_03770 [[Emmonsia] crescens]|uniref:Uncharacterized protein n=1 Tax=[Emmonsia] crescens TaxID=73230 RepID=A0A0G2J875_9EURO|nr:hypothetical protein EMCG_03770 [Emmonsia crescens UAMH 3008]
MPTRAVSRPSEQVAHLLRSSRPKSHGGRVDQGRYIKFYSQADTYDHGERKTGLPVRSAVLKPLESTRSTLNSALFMSGGGRASSRSRVTKTRRTEEQKLLEASKLSENAAAQGFTKQRQQKRETQENVECRKLKAPATKDTYDRAVYLWGLDKIFCFVNAWEAQTGRGLSAELKEDVKNFVIKDLTPTYNLPVKPRDKFLTTNKVINYLLRQLFEDDDHDYVHEIMRVYIGLSLTLFAGSGSRVGAVVESSAYRGTNECLYYEHLALSVKWSKPGEVEYWVTIDQKFIKGQRYKDEKIKPKNWIGEQKILGRNFMFWLMTVGLADQAFKGIQTLDKLLDVRPPRGRESLTFEWENRVENLTVFRMVTSQGPDKSKALSFSSLRHHYKSLSQRDSFRDPLRVHGIRGGVANKLDSSVSRESRSQALDHQNPETFSQYQSQVKAVDIQAAFWDEKPNHDCLEMERSMTHHRDTNVPQQLSSVAIAEVESDPGMIDLKRGIAELTSKIDGRPKDHSDLVSERDTLYSKQQSYVVPSSRSLLQNGGSPVTASISQVMSF